MRETQQKYCLDSRYTKVSLSVVFFVLVLLFFSVIFFLKQDREERLMGISDHVIQNFRSGLDYEMVDLLSFSMALAEDGDLKNALNADDEAKGYKILRQITERFKKYTHLKSLRMQVLTPDFYIFARSWNEGFEGMPIWWFRNDLRKLAYQNEPKVGMETGRLLTFKATVPIRSGERLLGYLEVIKLIDEFALKLRQKGIELFALMDEKYLKQASLMRDFPQLHGYVISNQNYNRQYLKALQHINWDQLAAGGYLYKDETLYLYEPMINGEGEKIGLYLLAISGDDLKKYEHKDQMVSLFTQFSDEDIKKVVEAWRTPYGSFRNGYDKALIGLLPKLRKEDKDELEMEAKSILQNYSKSELIDIILENKHNERKRGEIR